MSGERPILRAKLAAERAQEARRRAQQAAERLTELAAATGIDAVDPQTADPAQPDQPPDSSPASPAATARDQALKAVRSLQAARQHACEAHLETAAALERLARLYDAHVKDDPTVSARRYLAGATRARAEAALHRHLAEPPAIHLHHPGLQIRSQHDGDVAVCTLRGDLDTRTSRHLSGALAAHTDLACLRLVLDVTRLNSCDSSGLHVLILYAGITHTAGGCLRLAGTGGLVARALEISGLAEILPTDLSLAEALDVANAL